jgi:hypothetical protein
MEKLFARLLIALALACAVTAAWSCKSKRKNDYELVRTESDYHRPWMESCDVAHPTNRDGTPAHDWMVGGDGIYRCWYCNVVKRP